MAGGRTVMITHSPYKISPAISRRQGSKLDHARIGCCNEGDAHRRGKEWRDAGTKPGEAQFSARKHDPIFLQDRAHFLYSISTKNSELMSEYIKEHFSKITRMDSQMETKFQNYFTLITSLLHWKSKRMIATISFGAHWLQRAVMASLGQPASLKRMKKSFKKQNEVE